ncbi:MAG: hypothetical protein EOP49_32120 [Sphingobacteriales bacterium]|nr:MAG: hypothetical protein EOP49_32120 [Sphingobacteriales bacterium]
MKKISFLSGILRLATFSLLMGAAFSSTFVAVLFFAGLIFFSMLMPKQPGVAYGIVLETWANYIIERFWKDNPFLKASFDDSQYVVAGRIVHIPQPGSKPTVVKNRNTFPATAVRRTDTDITYSLDEYSTDPTHIPNIDSIHLSYSKQDSVLGEHLQILDETVADDMLIKWGGNATFVATTGGPNADTVPAVAGQTGTRKGFHHRDLQKLMITMNVANVPKQERYVMIDDNMFDYFYSSLGDTNAKDFSRYADATNGIVGKLHGFTIYTRSSVLAATNANAVKALGAALAATDNLCSIAWHKNSVAFAIGDKKLFQNSNDALYYGDVHSALVMAGGRVRRGDGLGVYIITQGA